MPSVGIAEHNQVKINSLRKVESEPEIWDQDKLRVFLKMFGVQQIDIANFIGVDRSTISHLVCGEVPFNPYREQLTAFKNATKKAKIAAAIAYAREMIKYYNSFE